MIENHKENIFGYNFFAIVLLMYPQANHHLIIRPVGLIRAEKKVYVLFRASNSGRKLLCLSLSDTKESPTAR